MQFEPQEEKEYPSHTEIHENGVIHSAVSMLNKLHWLETRVSGAWHLAVNEQRLPSEVDISASPDSIVTVTEEIAATWETALGTANGLFLYVARQGAQWALTHSTGILDSPKYVINASHVSTRATVGVPTFPRIDDILRVVPTEETAHAALRAPQTQVSRVGWALNEDKIQGPATQGIS